MAAERDSWPRGLVAGGLTALALLLPSDLYAQKTDANGEPIVEKREYVVQYVLVVLMSAMAVYCITKPSPRKSDKTLTPGG